MLSTSNETINKVSLLSATFMVAYSISIEAKSSTLDANDINLDFDCVRDCQQLLNTSFESVVYFPLRKDYRAVYKKVTNSPRFKMIYDNKSIGEFIRMEN